MTANLLGILAILGGGRCEGQAYHLSRFPDLQTRSVHRVQQNVAPFLYSESKDCVMTLAGAHWWHLEEVGIVGISKRIPRCRVTFSIPKFLTEPYYANILQNIKCIF